MSCVCWELRSACVPSILAGTKLYPNYTTIFSNNIFALDPVEWVWVAYTYAALQSQKAVAAYFWFCKSV